MGNSLLANQVLVTALKGIFKSRVWVPLGVRKQVKGVYKMSNFADALQFGVIANTVEAAYTIFKFVAEE